MLQTLLPPRRPWLDLYEPTVSNLLAQRISSYTSLCSASDDDDADDAALVHQVPLEVWLDIALHIELADFRAVCALGATCRALRPLGRHPQLWHHFCVAAFSARGFINPPERLLRCFNWSYRQMFRERKRLRYDGLYFVATTKLLAGLNEGRGMKEADKDFYNPGGRWVTSFRVFRFFPCGRMFSYLCSSHTPADVRKAAAQVTAERPQSLTQKLKGACWGAYDLREPNAAAALVGDAGGATPDNDDGGGGGGGGGGGVSTAAAVERPTHITARVVLHNEQYPNMVPATVRYVLEMRPIAGGGGDGSGDGGDAAGGGGGGGMVAGPSSSGGGRTEFQYDVDGGRRGARQPFGINNCDLYIVAHAIESGGTGELESIPPPLKPCSFLGFSGPVPRILPLRPLAPRASGQ